MSCFFFLIKEINFLGFIFDDCNKNFYVNYFEKNLILNLSQDLEFMMIIYDNYEIFVNYIIGMILIWCKFLIFFFINLFLIVCFGFDLL